MSDSPSRIPPDPLPIEPYFRGVGGCEPFLRAIAEEPDDDGPRLVFADYLEERGHETRAEFIRLQCESERDDIGRRVASSARLDQLLTAHGKTWREGVDNIGLSFSRGMLEAASLSILVELMPQQQARVDIRSVTVHTATLGKLACLFQCDRLRFVTLLRSQPRLTNALIDILAASPYLTALPFLSKLHSLDLGSARLDEVDFLLLLASPHFLRLRPLGLEFGHLRRDAARVIANSEKLSDLTHLDLSRNALVGDDALALTASSRLSRLEWLDLRKNKISAARRTLADRRHLAQPDSGHSLTVSLILKTTLMTTATAAPPTRFHIGLHTADLGRAIRFYTTLFGHGPAKHHDDYAKFEVERPPLVLALYPSPQQPGGSLNHVGLRMPDSTTLVEVQRRLEEAGIATQRQEGVECCYARQTKFWVTDPDRVLWELYTLEEDLEHSGFDDPPMPQSVAPEAIWEHHITAAWPEKVPHGDGSLDEVRLEGSFNAPVAAERLTALVAEVFRALRPGGRVAVHGLVGDKPFPGEPKLPGLAGLVKRVPAETEPLAALRSAGFAGLHYEKLGDIHCFRLGNVELRELRLVGHKPAGCSGAGTVTVMYKGPLAQVEDERGTVFRRGVPVQVPTDQAETLRLGLAAEQFALPQG